MTPTVTEFHVIHTIIGKRRLAYKRLGSLSASHVFLCLPGLLETSESFDQLFEMIDKYDDVCWLSLDYCGRGQSDPLSIAEAYVMTTYLGDIESLIASVLNPLIAEGAKVHLIGTSMGGILAMYLAQRTGEKFKSIVLNDIGLYLNWSALIALYQDLRSSRQMNHSDQIHSRAVQAVYSRSHFDLPLSIDMVGMRFGDTLKNYNGHVTLLHNNESPICPLPIALQSKEKYPKLKIWTLKSDKHPALWTDRTVAYLAEMTKLKPKLSRMQLPLPAEKYSPLSDVPAQSAVGAIERFMTISKAYLSDKEKIQARVYRFLKSKIFHT